MVFFFSRSETIKIKSSSQIFMVWNNLCYWMQEQCLDLIILLQKHGIRQHVRMAERSKAPDSRVKLFLTGAFWSTNVGVGSNPTSDKRFRLLRKCAHTVGLHWISVNSERKFMNSRENSLRRAFSAVVKNGKRSWSHPHSDFRNIVRGTSSNGRALA